MKTLNPTFRDILPVVLDEWKEFLQTAPKNQKEIYYKIIKNKLIRMFYVGIRYDDHPEIQNGIFSLDVNSLEENINLGKGKYAKEIGLTGLPNTESINSHLPFFTKTLELLPSWVHTGFVVNCKKGATFNYPCQTKTPKTMFVSILLKDIKDGEIIANGSTINKKGDHFTLFVDRDNSFVLTGTTAIFFTIGINIENENLIFQE